MGSKVHLEEFPQFLLKGQAKFLLKVRTNEPSFSSARLFIILHTNRVDSVDAEKDFRESTVRISDCRASSILKSVPVSQDSK